MALAGGGSGHASHRLGQRAGELGVVEDLIVKHGEVESQPQADGVCGLHLLLADVESLLVSPLGIVYRFCEGRRMK